MSSVRLMMMIMIKISSVTGGGGGSEFPQRLLTGKFLQTYREKRGKEKNRKGRGYGEERTIIVKGKVEN